MRLMFSLPAVVVAPLASGPAAAPRGGARRGRPDLTGTAPSDPARFGTQRPGTHETGHDRDQSPGSINDLGRPAGSRSVGRSLVGRFPPRGTRRAGGRPR